LPKRRLALVELQSAKTDGSETKKEWRMAAASKSKSMGLSIVIGIAIGTLAAILSSHVAVWLLAGIFVGIAAGASVGRKKCPECEARQHAGTNHAAPSDELRARITAS
jgi:hypothetical protein